jgi:prophage maintenance system killer protein
MDVSVGEIITINKELGGDLVAPGSIEYALQAGAGRSLYWRIALLWRAILVDHPFTDVNKRTAFNTTTLALKRGKVKVTDEMKERILGEILKVAKENITEVKRIERRVRYAVEGN